jgi:DNA-binding winged helix-turn-helix (wHTH) protein
VPIERKSSAVRRMPRLHLISKQAIRKSNQSPHVIRQATKEPVLRFGPFEMNLERREMRKHGMKLRLEDKPFELLRLLVSQPGRVVSREELCAALWPDTFVCFEHSLNTAVNKLRSALGDSARSSHYLETVRRCGYRFAGAMQEDGPPEKSRKRTVLMILPFRTPRPDADMENAAVDFTEEVSAHLARRNPEQLAVLASSAAVLFKGSQSRVDFGETPQADLILEGTARISAGHVRIIPQLVRVSDGVCIWSEIYDWVPEQGTMCARTAARSLCSAILAGCGKIVLSE